MILRVAFTRFEQLYSIKWGRGPSVHTGWEQSHWWQSRGYDYKGMRPKCTRQGLEQRTESLLEELRKVLSKLQLSFLIERQIEPDRRGLIIIWWALGLVNSEAQTYLSLHVGYLKWYLKWGIQMVFNLLFLFNKHSQHFLPQ